MEKQMNYKIIIQYDGSRYDGWQKQGNTSQTIQGKIEAVLCRYAGEEVEVHGAGRTDAGVHALGQTANFHLAKEADAQELLEYLNRYLPEDIEITELVRVPERFHSRLNAAEKTYRYRVETGSCKHVFERKQIYRMEDCRRTLDLEAMRRAADLLEGTHDFKSFCANKRMKKSTVRTVKRIGITRRGTEYIFDYTGDGFLYNMVRILTGTLLEVGLGKRDWRSMEALLEAKDRSQAGFTAPAQGLTLLNVRY